MTHEINLISILFWNFKHIVKQNNLRREIEDIPKIRKIKRKSIKRDQDLAVVTRKREADQETGVEIDITIETEIIPTKMINTNIIIEIITVLEEMMIEEEVVMTREETGIDMKRKKGKLRKVEDLSG